MKHLTPIAQLTEKVPGFAKYKFDDNDVDVTLLLHHLLVPIGKRALIVGAHDESTANLLAASGLDVTGIDLRTYDSTLPECNFTYIRGDFCDPETTKGLESFHMVVCLSAIEHFGMAAYQEGSPHRYYDVIAMRKIWELLEVGGHAYITVPFGSHYMEIWPHWRVYDLPSVKDRLVQDFHVVTINCSSSETLMLDGRERKAKEILSIEDASKWSGMPPTVQTILVLEKEL